MAVLPRTVRPMACADDGAFAAAVPSHSVVGLPALSPTMVSPHAGPAPPRTPPHKASAPQTEGSISSWLVSVGEEVEVGDVFCEIETDKATVEMECQDTCESPPPPLRPATLLIPSVHRLHREAPGGRRHSHRDVHAHHGDRGGGRGCRCVC